MTAACDVCQGNVQDVSARFESLAQYEKWLCLWPKTKGQTPQSFHGEDYWLRDPTFEEGDCDGCFGIQPWFEGCDFLALTNK